MKKKKLLFHANITDLSSIVEGNKIPAIQYLSARMDVDGFLLLNNRPPNYDKQADLEVNTQILEFH
jgi:hypothetical protein